MDEHQIMVWNKKFPSGTLGFLTKDDGTVIPTKTRSEAWLTGDGTAIVKVDGIAGGYLLSRFKPIE